LRCHGRLDLCSGILATPTLLWYYAASYSSMRPNLSGLRHHPRLKSSSCRTTCGIIAGLNRHLVGRLAASLPNSIVVLYDDLRHPHCRLDLYSSIIATPSRLWYYAASCSSMRTNLISLAAFCRLKSTSRWMTCGIIADFNRRLVGRLASSSLPTSIVVS
jgi:hypothetical protein